MKKFSSNRYMTKRISEDIPTYIQAYLWNKIDEMADEGQELDYLQVMKLSKEGQKLVIEHTQEVPEMKRTYVILPQEDVGTGKIYVIDSEEYATMLWADEY